TYLNSLGHKFLVIGLTETWLNNENVNDFSMSQYNLIAKALCVKQSYHYKERNDIAINVNQHSNVFLNNIFSSSFYPLITKPITRITK
ncbi:unnamed protein product, partial [Porites evermanni]